MTPQVAAMLAVGLIGTAAVLRKDLFFATITLIVILALYAR